jgi:hypothetical protein
MMVMGPHLGVGVMATQLEDFADCGRLRRMALFDFLFIPLSVGSRLARQRQERTSPPQKLCEVSYARPNSKSEIVAHLACRSCRLLPALKPCNLLGSRRTTNRS